MTKVSLCPHNIFKESYLLNIINHTLIYFYIGRLMYYEHIFREIYIIY